MQRIADTNHLTLTDPKDGYSTLAGSLWYSEDEDIVYIMPYAKHREDGPVGDPHQHGGITVLGIGRSTVGGECNMPTGFNCNDRPE